MTEKLDLTQGGYQGDSIEETFKPFTAEHMSYWWFFREILRPSDGRAPYHVRKTSGEELSDGEKREFVALSLLGYQVYTNVFEAYTFFQEMVEHAKQDISAHHDFHATRAWKALYSSLYRSVTAMANTACVVYCQKSPLGHSKRGEIRNYTPRGAINLLRGRGCLHVASFLESCEDRLKIRHQLDHYWLIWKTVGKGHFLIDAKYVEKAYVAIDPSELDINVNAIGLAYQHILDTVHDFNDIYRDISVEGGPFDQYIESREWVIVYDDYGPPHNGKRPVPVPL